MVYLSVSIVPASLSTTFEVPKIPKCRYKCTFLLPVPNSSMPLALAVLGSFVQFPYERTIVRSYCGIIMLTGGRRYLVRQYHSYYKLDGL